MKGITFYTAITICLVMVVILPVSASETLWEEGTVGDWNDADCWDYGIPRAGVSAYLLDGGIATIPLYYGGETKDIKLDSGDGKGLGKVIQLGNMTCAWDLFIGHDNGSAETSVYHLQSGTLTIEDQCDGSVQIDDSGMFIHDGGTLDMQAIETPGFFIDGKYLLREENPNHPSLLLSNGIDVGDDGAGQFVHTKGTSSMCVEGGALLVAKNAGSTGTYQLGDPNDANAVPELESLSASIGRRGTGTFLHYGGIHTVHGTLHVGGGSSESDIGTGAYMLDDGTLTAEEEVVSRYGSGTFLHYGGSNTINDDGTDQIGTLYVGLYDDGTYVLGDPNDQSATPQLTAEMEVIAAYGEGLFKHIGGTNTISTTDPGEVGELFIATSENYRGTYLLGLSDYGTASPELNADNEYIGEEGTGALIQDHGTNMATKIFVGYKANCSGTYTMDGGALVVEKLFIGDDGTDDGTTNYGVGTPDIYGTFDIDDSTADIDVGNKVVFGLDSEFEATVNSEMTIELGEDDSTAPETGEWLIRFVDDGTYHDPADLDGLGNLTLNCEFAESIVSSSTYNVANALKFEACGEGKKPNDVTINDFTSANFVIDKLVISRDDNEIDGEAGKITVSLMNAFDNQDDGTGESVYVKTLEMKAGAELATGTIQLYYRNGGNPKEFRQGDTNLDGAVDIVDLTALAANWYNSGLQWSQGDFTGDRIIDIVDLTALGANWGGEGDLGTAASITVDTTAHDTDGLSGYTTIEVTLSTGDITQIMCGFDLTFDADTMNQVNPYGVIPTIFENYNEFLTAAEIDQDSQFEFDTGTDALQVQGQSESGTGLAAVFAFLDGVDNNNASDQILVAHVVVPSAVEVSLTGSVTIYDAATKERIDTVGVDETLNEQ